MIASMDHEQMDAKTAFDSSWFHLFDFPKILKKLEIMKKKMQKRLGWLTIFPKN